MTIKEIAELAGVSVSTVSKIVNGKDQYINPATRERVLKLVKEYNYTPYGTVKNLTSPRTFLIGVLLDTTEGSSRLVSGIMQAAQAHGYNIILMDSRRDPLLETKHITALCRHRADGVILRPVSPDTSRQLRYFSERDIPVLTAGNDYISPSCTIDYTSLGYAAAKSLLDNRHSRIACIFHRDGRRENSVLEGYRRCLFDYQIPFEQDLQIDADSADSFRKFLESGATGAVCSHLTAGLSLYRQLKKMHYDIPEDYSIVSLKDDLGEPFTLDRISGPSVPDYAFGTYLCEKLISSLEDPNVSAETGNCSFRPDTAFDCRDTVSIPAALRARKIVVVGSIHTDFTFSVDHIPQSGKTTTIRNSISAPGGKGVNQAIGAARLGRQVALIGEIGSDLYSSYIMNMLEDEHISTRGIHKDPNLPTGTAYIYIEDNGEGTITILPGANDRLTPEKIRDYEIIFDNASYCLISTEIPAEAAAEAAAAAVRHGVKTILKPAAMRELPEKLYRYTDILIPNRREAATLCPGCDSIEKQAEYLLDKGVSTVIITLGHNGCYLRTRELEESIPAADTIPVDTTGGADAFIAALASYLTEGYPLSKAVRIAVHAAALCVSKQGVVAGLADKNTLEAHIRKTEPELLN